MTESLLVPLLTAQEVQAINEMIFNYQFAVAAAIILGIALAAVGGAWLIYEKWFTPVESKKLRDAFRRKRPLLVEGGDDGFADMTPAHKSLPEGVLSTKPQGRGKDNFIGALPRPHKYTESDLSDVKMPEALKAVNNEDMTEAEKKKLQTTLSVANYLDALANRRLLLRGSKIPVWFAYRGKAILTSIYWLVAVQMLEAMAKAGEFEEAFGTVDLVAIKALFPIKQWNVSQLKMQELDAERTGELKAKKFAGKDSLILMFAIMIILVVVVIMLIAVIYFFTH